MKIDDKFTRIRETAYARYLMGADWQPKRKKSVAAKERQRIFEENNAKRKAGLSVEMPTLPTEAEENDPEFREVYRRALVDALRKIVGGFNHDDRIEETVELMKRLSDEIIKVSKQ